jgi:hypothetical protein
MSSLSPESTAFRQAITVINTVDPWIGAAIAAELAD